MKKLILLAGMLVSMYSIQAQTYEWQQIGSDIHGKVDFCRSGWSVSLSSDGSIVAIGIPYNDENGTDAGCVSVYQNSLGAWQQIGLDILGKAVNDRSGWSVSLSSDGKVVAIGAPNNDANEIRTGTGLVRVYQNNAGNWQQIGSEIVGETVRDHFGRSVSLSSDGSVVVIGAPNPDFSGDYFGYARVYKNESGNWQQIGMDIDGEAAGDNSGWSVSLSSDGSIVAIGAPYENGDESGAGIVKIYKNTSGTWQQIGLAIDGEAAGDNSGYSVSLSSDGMVVAIGAFSNDGNGLVSGNVRLYKNNSGSWQQIGSDIDGEAQLDRSGWSVSLSSDGSVVAIGACWNAANGQLAGHVRVYKNNLGTWQQIGQDIDGDAAGDFMGHSVSLSSNGSVLAIGAPYNGSHSFIGQVKIYKCVNGNVGMNDLTQSGISISPNPTRDKIAITGNSDKTIENITITDITGKTVIKRSDIKQNGEIELSGLGKGIYIIALQTEKEIFTTKIIKE